MRTVRPSEGDDAASLIDVPTLRASNLDEGLERAARSDAQLVVLVNGDAPKALRTAAKAAQVELGWRGVDLNRDLTERLIATAPAERQVALWEVFEDVVGELSDGVVLLTTDILFEPSLGFRPYEAIRRIARRGPVVAAWFGTVEGAFITRAQPGHPEYTKSRLDVPYVVVRRKEGVGR